MPRSYALPLSEFKRLRSRADEAQRLDQSEVCGVLIGSDSGPLKLHFLPNRSERPGSFSIRLTEVTPIRRRLRGSKKRILGYFHSHPVGDAMLGPRDLQETPLNRLHLVYDVCFEEPRLWRAIRRNGKKVAIELPLELARWKLTA